MHRFLITESYSNLLRAFNDYLEMSSDCNNHGAFLRRFNHNFFSLEVMHYLWPAETWNLCRESLTELSKGLKEFVRSGAIM